MTSVVYKPESVGKVNDKGRGAIYNKNCAASSLDDKQESIKRDTLIAALRQGEASPILIYISAIMC